MARRSRSHFNRISQIKFGSRRQRRAEQAMYRTRKSDRRWMSWFMRREERREKLRKLFRPFMPLNFAFMLGIWNAAMSWFFDGTQAPKVATSRAGMIKWGGDDKPKRRRKKGRRNSSKLNAQEKDYQPLEPRQMLAVDLPVYPPVGGVDLTVSGSGVSSSTGRTFDFDLNANPYTGALDKVDTLYYGIYNLEVGLDGSSTAVQLGDGDLTVTGNTASWSRNDIPFTTRTTAGPTALTGRIVLDFSDASDSSVLDGSSLPDGYDVPSGQNTSGAVLAIREADRDFTANIKFEILDGSTWVSAQSYYDSNTGSGVSGGLFTSFFGGFWQELNPNLSPLTPLADATPDVYEIAGDATDITLSINSSEVFRYPKSLTTTPTSSFYVSGSSDDDSFVISDSSPTPSPVIIDGGNGLDSYTLAGGLIVGLNTGDGTADINLQGEIIQGFGTISGSFDGDATSVISASGSGLTIGDGSASGFATDGELNVNSSTVSIDDAGTVTPLGHSTIVGAGGTLQHESSTTTDFELASGAEITGEGTVTSGIRLRTGSIKGELTITGGVDGDTAGGDGSIEPGFSPGTTNLGSLTLTSGDTLAIEVADADVAGSDYDLINVTGAAVLGGATLDLTSLSYDPAVGDVVTFLTAGTLTGTFGAVTGASHFRGGVAAPTAELIDGDVLGFAGDYFRINYSGNAVVLTALIAEVEFDDGNSFRNEDGLGGNAPAIIVSGDLAGTPEAARTLDFSLTAGTATAGPSDDFTLDLSFIIPEGDYSTTNGVFDLTDYDSNGIQSGQPGFTDAVLEINNDTLIEGNEGLSFNFLNGIGTALVAGNVDGDGAIRTGTTHTIDDNDTLRITVNPGQTVVEGNTLNLGLTIETSSDDGVTYNNSAQVAPGAQIDIDVADLLTGSADSGDDYPAIADTTLTFTGGYSGGTDTVSIATTDDSLVESNETVDIGFNDLTSSPANRPEQQVSSVGNFFTITDNDNAEWSLTQSATSIAEDTGSVTYTFALTGTLQAGETATVDIDVLDLTTTLGADYPSPVAAINAAVSAWNTANPGAGTLSTSFAGGSAPVVLTYTAGAGNTSLTPSLEVTLSPTDDTTVEADEQVQVAISNAGGTVTNSSVSTSDNLVVTTIEDDDVATWSLTQSSGGTVNENGGSITYTFALSGTLEEGETATVDVDVVDISTTLGVDYPSPVAAINTAVANWNTANSPANGTLSTSGGGGSSPVVLTYTAGAGDTALAPSLAVTLSPINDGIVESNETVQVTISNAGGTIANPEVSSSDNSVTTTIVDDDIATWSITQTTSSVSEGSSHTFTFSLDGLIQDGETTSVEIQVVDLATTLGLDYGSPVAAINAAVAAYTGPGILTGSFAGGTAPYVLTYQGDVGNTSMDDLNVVVNAIADGLSEGPEDVRVDIANAGGTIANPSIDGSNDSVTTTIIDGDSAQWSFTADSTANEGDAFDVTLSLAGDVQAGEILEVNFGFANSPSGPSGDATEAADFDPLRSQQIQDAIDAYNLAGHNGTFARTGTTFTYTQTTDGPVEPLVFQLNSIDDRIAEGSEDLEAFMDTPASPTGADISITGPTTQDMTVLDNDNATWSITQTASSVAEGNSVDYTISLIMGGVGTGTPVVQAGDSVSVEIDGTDLGTDNSDYSDPIAALNAAITAYNSSGPGTYALSTATDPNNVILTFTAGGSDAVPGSLTASVNAISDGIAEGSESVQLALVAPGDPDQSTISNVQVSTSDGQVTTEIIDTNTAEWSLTQSSSSVAEDTGSVTYTFALAGTLQAGETATVDIDVTDITTMLGIDYPSPVAAINAAVSAWNSSNSPANGTLSTSFAGGSAPVVLTYTAGAGNTALTPSLEVTLSPNADTVVEADETVQVTISNAGGSITNALISTSDNSVTTTIEDDDQAEWSLTQSTSTVAEDSGSVTYTFALSGTLQAGETATVDVDVIDLTTTLGADYPSPVAAINAAVAAWNTANPGAGTLATSGGGGSSPVVLTYTAGAGNTSLTPSLEVTLSPTNDSIVEADEQVQVTISNAGGTIANALISSTDNSVTTTIEDDDQAEWSLTQSASSITEDTGSVTYTFALTGTLQAGETATVDIDVVDLTTDSADYPSPVAAISAAVSAWNTANPGAGTLSTSFAGGSAPVVLTYTAGAGDTALTPSLEVTLSPVDDTVVEADEQVQVNISNAGGTIANALISTTDNSVTTTIEDDDVAEWSLTQSSSTVNEGTGSVTYTFALSGTLQDGETATVDIDVIDITTTLGADYPSPVAAINAAVSAWNGSYGPGAGTLSTSFAGGTAPVVLTYTAGSGNTSLTPSLAVTLSPIDDAFVEGPEDVQVTITNAGGSIANAMISTTDNSVTTTIVDDDSTTWILTDTNSTTGEVDEGDSATYDLELSGSPVASGDTATIDIGFSLIGPTSSADFSETLADAVTAAVNAYNFGAGTTAGDDNSFEFDGTTVTYNGDGTTDNPTLNIDLDTFEDDGASQPGHLANLVEPDEDFEISISNPGGTAAPQISGADTLTTTIVDDDTAEVSLMLIQDASEDPAGPGVTAGAFKFVLSNPSQTSVSVNYTDSGTGGTATPGVDYNALPGTGINFAPGVTEVPLNVVPFEDFIVEGPESVIIRLDGFTNPSLVDPQISIATAPGDETTVSIEDNDTAALTLNNVTVDEAAGTIDVTVTLDNAVAGGFTVPYMFTDGTATGGTDYDNTGGTLNFSGTVGETQTITIPINNDSDVEADETFFVSLGTPVPNTATLPASSIDATDDATVTITNDDIDLNLESAVPGSQAEGDSGTTDYTFEVTRTGLTTGTTTVNYAVTGTGTNPADADDFGGAFPSGTVTFAPGETSQTITISVSGDSTVELDEDFTVTLSGQADTAPNVDTVEINNASSAATIENDDAAVLTVNDVTVDEAAGTAMVTVGVDNAVQGGFSVDYATSDDTANAGSDYTATSGTLNFMGNAGETKSFTIPITDDMVLELAETLNISLNNVVAGQANPGDIDATDTAVVTITDNDTAILTVADVTVNEAAGTATVSVSIDNAVQGGFTVDYTTGNDTAIAGSDYTATSGTLTFAGNAGEVQTFTIPITDDAVLELDETLNVSLSNVMASQADPNDIDDSDTAVVTIVDNDTAILTVSDITVDEAAGTAMVTVTIDNAVQGGFSVDYATGDDTAIAGSDYTAASGTLNFAGTAGESQSFTIPITDDMVLELAETLNVSLSNVTATEADPSDIDDSDVGVVTITDNDTAILTVADITVDEGDGNAFVTVVLDKAVQGGFSVDYQTNNGTAISGMDYLNTSGTLTFDGTAGETETFLVPINDDMVLELNENFTVTLDNVTASQADPNDIDATDSSTITIVDNDTAILTVSNITVSEAAGTATVTVGIDKAVQGGFSVDYATGDDTAADGSDYTGATGTLSFAGTAGETQSFTVAITDDMVLELDETFNVSLSNVTATQADPNDIDDSDVGVVTIVDNDTAVLTVADVTVNEGDGTATVTVSVDNAVQGGFSVDYATSDDSAVAGSDYTASTGTLNFAGTAGESQSFTIPITDDMVLELAESLNVSLSNVVATQADPSDIDDSDTAVVTIVDNDTAILTVADVTVDEAAGTATVTVSVDKAVQGGFTVDYATSDGTANAGSDYTMASGTLNFDGTAGETETFTVSITDDAVLELAETLNISLSNVTASQADPSDIDATDTAIVTITDNDTAILTVADVTVNEADGTATVTVAIDNAVQGGFTVDYATSDGTAADGSDYTGTTGTLNFAGNAGETQSFTVAITDDMVLELDETFDVTLSNVTASQADPNDIDANDTATVTIVDNDTAILTVADITVSEADGTATVTVEIDKAVQGGFTVDYSTGDDTAIAGSDYTAASGTLTFAGTAGETQTFDIAITDDMLVEIAETLNVSLSGVSASEADPADIDANDTAVVTITNDDTANVTIDDVTVNEPDLGDPNAIATFTISIDKAADQDITVEATTLDGTATAGSNDYVSKTQTVTIPAGSTSATFDVEVIGDNFVELDENFFVELSEPAYDGDFGDSDPLTGGPDAGSGTPQVEITDATGEGTINNEDAIIEFDEIQSTKTEDGVTGVGPTLLVRGDLTGTSDASRTIIISTVGGTATNGTDYVLSNTFIVPEGDYSGTIGSFDLTLYDSDGNLVSTSGNDPVLDVINDMLLEGDESLNIQRQGLGSSLQDGDVDGNSINQLNTEHVIGDDEAAVLEIVDVSVLESDAPAAETVQVALNITGSGTGPAMLAPGVFIVGEVTDKGDGTATSGDDYDAFTPQNVVFIGGDMDGATESVTINTNADNIVEADETVNLEILPSSISTSPASVNVTTDDGTVTIVNDDSAQVSIDDVTVTEGDSGTTTATFTVTLSEAASEDVTVDYTTTDGSAMTADGDYIAIAGTLTFAPGVLSQTISVDINGDVTVEPDELFTVDLSNAQFDGASDPTRVTISDNQGQGTILNDDSTEVSINDVSVTEGDSGTTTATFTVSLTEAASEDITVDYMTMDGSATTADGDYISIAGTVTFAPGVTSQTISVDINGDVTVEPDELFTVNLSDAQFDGTTDPTRVTIFDNQGVGTILNDDTAEVTIDDVTVTEGDSGTTAATFTVSLSNAASEAITVDYTTTDGSAMTADGDYLTIAGTLTFAPGVVSQTISVDINGDVTVEADELFTVDLSNAQFDGASDPTRVVIVDGQGEGTITNDDSTEITISNVAVAEGDSGTTTATFTVTLSEAASEDITVAYTTNDGTATTADGDYITAAGVLTFAPGVTSQTISVLINGDVIVEPNELFTVDLSDAQFDGATDPTRVTITDNQGLGTIVNDDSTEVTINDISVNEGDSGITTAIFTVSLTEAASENVTVAFTTTDGSAMTADGDYVGVSGTLTFAPGVTSQTISVDINGDVTVEPDELFTVDLSNAQFNGATDASRVTIGDNQGQGTILNDDSTEVSIDDVTVTEGDSGTTTATFTVTLSEAASENVTVDYTTTDGSAMTADGDYIGIAGTVTFAPGVLSQTISVDINGDVTVEPDELFTVDLSNAQFDGASDPTRVTISDAQGEGTITNDDSTEVSIDDVVITEGDSGTTTATFTVTLSEAASEDVTVDYATNDGSATTADGDYVGVSGTLTFAPGVTSQTIMVDINGDVTVEADELFTVDLSNAQFDGASDPTRVTISDAQGEGTITNDDSTEVSIDDVTVTEGDSGTTTATFTVTLTEAASEEVTVDYATNDGTATTADGDYVGVSGTLTFAPGVLSQTISVDINGDVTVEPDELFTVDLSNAQFDGASDPTRVTITDAQGEGTITNDDSATISITAVQNGSEAGPVNAIFDVTLSNPSSTDTTVFISLPSGAPALIAQEGADYTRMPVVIPAGSTTGQLIIEVIDDNVVENTEFVNALVTGSDNPLITPDSGAFSATLSIEDNDEAFVRIVPIQDGNEQGPVVGLFEAQLVDAAGNLVTASTDILVNYFPGGTATEGGVNADYPALSNNLTITAGTSSKGITIDTIDDTLIEGTETVVITLTSLGAGTDPEISLATGGPEGNFVDQILIFDNDGVATLNIDDFSVAEGDPGDNTTLNFTVTLSEAVAQDVTFVVNTMDDTAVAGDDFAAISGVTYTIPAGDTSVTVSVDIAEELLVELDETFKVLISDAQFNGVTDPSLVTIADGEGVGTIENDDSATVSIDSVTLNEGNDPDTTDFEFTITLDQPVDVNVDVDADTADDTATVADGDYDAVDATVTFTAGAAGTQTVTVTVNGDDTVELDEVFKLVLSNLQASGRDVSFFGASASLDGLGTITNDDSATISIDDVSESEGDSGTKTFDFTVTLSNPVDTAIDVTADTADGTATAPSDYVAIAGQNVAFSANDTTPQTISVTVNGDTDVEADEVFNVLLSALNDGGRDVTILDGSGEGTIINDDSAVNISPTSLALDEGHDTDVTTFSFTVTRTGDLSAAATVDFDVFGTGANPATAADFAGGSLPSGMVMFAPGASTAVIEIEIAGDNDVEPYEDFEVVLSNPTSTNIGVGTALATIVNDDIDVSITASVTKYEGDTGTTEFVYTLTRTGEIDGETTVDYDVTGSGINPADAADFVGGTLPSGTVTFPAGDATTTLTIEVAGDTDVEPDENFIITLSNPDDSVPAHDVELIDNVSTQLASFTMLASGSLSGSPSTTTGVTDNFFQLSNVGPVNITNLQIDLAPGLYFGDDAINLGGTEDVFVLNGTGDAADPGTDFTGPNSIPEGSTSAFLSFGDFDGGAPGEVFEFFIETTQITGSGPVGATGDVLAGSTITVTFSDGSMLTGMLALNGNAEQSELSLTAPPTGGSVATGMILNDDVDVELGAADLPSQDEGDNGDTTPYNFTVTRSGNLAGTLTVDYEVVGIGSSPADAADFVGNVLPSGTVTFGPGVTSQTISIEVNGDDVIELDENFEISLLPATASDTNTNVNNVDVDAAPEGAVIVNDDDGAVVSVQDITVDETAGTITVTVELTGAVQDGFSVDYATSDDSATDGDDYTAASGTLTFAGNDGETQTFTLDILDDPSGTLVELTESLNIELSNVNPVSVPSSSIGTDDGVVTITDPDTAEVTLVANDATADEDADDGQFTITLSEASATDTTVTLTPSGDADNSDLNTPVPTTVTILAGDTTATIDIDAFDDASVEGPEDLTLTASIANPGVDADIDITVGAQDSDTVTITDGNTADLTVVADDATGTEDPDDDGNFRFELSTPAQNDVTFTYTISGSATAGDDYTALSGTGTILAGDTFTDVAVDVLDDNMVEFDEDVTVQISGITSVGTVNIGSPDTATVTIESEDTATLFFDLVESNDGTEFGPTNGKFVAKLSNPVAFSIDVGYSIGGTASNSADYNSISGGLFFGPGVTEIPIDIIVVDDMDLEGDETVELTLTDILSPGSGDPGFGLVTIIAAPNATQSDTDIVTIHDNDADPIVDDQTFNVDENSPNGTVVDTIVFDDVDLPEDELTITVTGGTGDTAFAVDPSSGEITVADSAQLDFETTTSFTLEVLVTDSAGNTDTAVITIDINDVFEPTGPTVTDIIVSSTEWTDAFKDFVDGNGVLNEAGGTGRGYYVPKGAAQTESLPWMNANQVIVQFDQDVVDVDASDFSFALTPGFIGLNGFADGGTVGQVPTIDTVVYDALTNSATLTFASGSYFEATALQLIIDSTGIQDSFGNDLDGEWTTGSTNATSGDGIAGGDFVFEMITLPGDVDGVVKSAGQVIVDADDFVAVSTLSANNEFVLDAGGTNVASGGFDPRGDLDGNGFIDAFDVVDVIDEQNAIVLPSSSLRSSGRSGFNSRGFQLQANGFGGSEFGDESDGIPGAQTPQRQDRNDRGQAKTVFLDDLTALDAGDDLLQAIESDRNDEVDVKNSEIRTIESIDRFFGNQF